MIKILDYIAWACLVFSVFNTYKAAKEGNIITVINVFSYTLISRLVWIASYFYIDENNLSGSSLLSYLFIVQVILIIASLTFVVLKDKKENPL